MSDFWKYCRAKEQLEEVHRFLKELELERIENDILNVHKFDCLYEVYRRLKNIVEEYENGQ